LNVKKTIDYKPKYLEHIPYDTKLSGFRNNLLKGFAKPFFAKPSINKTWIQEAKYTLK